jgi:hypothetical protein
LYNGPPFSLLQALPAVADPYSNPRTVIPSHSNRILPPITAQMPGAGQWQAVFAFPLAAVPVGQTPLSLSLVARRS